MRWEPSARPTSISIPLSGEPTNFTLSSRWSSLKTQSLKRTINSSHSRYSGRLLSSRHSISRHLYFTTKEIGRQQGNLLAKYLWYSWSPVRTQWLSTTLLSFVPLSHLKTVFRSWLHCWTTRCSRQRLFRTSCSYLVRTSTTVSLATSWRHTSTSASVFSMWTTTNSCRSWHLSRRSKSRASKQLIASKLSARGTDRGSLVQTI